MNDKINVCAILAKHMTQKGDRGEENLAAIKEIVEAVIDKCAEEATAKIETEWDGNTGSEYPNDYAVINKESILNIKKEIEYE